MVRHGRSRLALVGDVTSQESSDLVAIAARGHGTPAPPVRTGVIVKKQPAGRIGAAANGRFKTLYKEICSRTSDGGEEPLESLLARHELETPSVFPGNQLVMAFRDAKDFINRFYPMARELLSFYD